MAFNLEYMEYARAEKNYEVVYGKKKNGKCLVCFSSNSIYFPHTNDNLINLIRLNRYEWKSLIDYNDYELVVFVRDVYKQWYINGINKSIDTPDKLIQLLNGLIFGYEAIFLGVSAGGYAAVYYGTKCMASRIITFSGQFDLSENANDPVNNPILSSLYKKSDSIVDSTANVYYVLPVRSKQDLLQYERVKDNNNICCIKVLSDKHGLPIPTFSVNKFIKRSNVYLKKMSIVERTVFSITILNFSFKNLFQYMLIKANSYLHDTKLHFK